MPMANLLRPYIRGQEAPILRGKDGRPPITFMTRVIRQKNGIDTLYTLRTSSGSGDAVLTNEKLLRVASRRREVQISGQNPFRG